MWESERDRVMTRNSEKEREGAREAVRWPEIAINNGREREGPGDSEREREGPWMARDSEKERE